MMVQLVFTEDLEFQSSESSLTELHTLDASILETPFSSVKDKPKTSLSSGHLHKLSLLEQVFYLILLILLDED